MPLFPPLEEGGVDRQTDSDESQIRKLALGNQNELKNICTNIMSHFNIISKIIDKYENIT